MALVSGGAVVCLPAFLERGAREARALPARGWHTALPGGRAPLCGQSQPCHGSVGTARAF